MDDSVSGLFLSHARGTPAALALAENGRTVTYGELEARSRSLAASLTASGVVRGDVVALHARRSISQIVGALGILRAGAGFLPIDPTLPRERATYQVEETRASAVVAGSGSTVPPQGDGVAPVIRLDDDGTCARSAPSDWDDARVPRREHDLAYVIYTSGSTGRPKGVEIVDGALANLAAWHRSTFDVRPDDRASHIASVSFDAAVWEVWPYLSAGASVHIADDVVARDPEAFRDWLLGEGITIGFAVTPVMERLMELSWPRETSLRTMLTGADRLRRYASAALPFPVVNNYGPTETTVVATSGVVPIATSTVDRLERFPSIGRPIRKTRLYVLDDRRVPVADGCDGEIWVAGAGVARGYAGRPELTAERFALDPFDASGTARMYRTGDRGKILPDGNVAFLGRLDDQLKVRGYRIEAGEVEAALDACAGIAQSAVVVAEGVAGDERLVAYVVPTAATEAPGGERIRHDLARRLPAYMIPSQVVTVSSIPLTANGKIDRAALRQRSLDGGARDGASVAPQTPTEIALAAIVATLLRLDGVSATENFFVLGGHSLLGTQVIARVRDAFGVRIGLRYLFEHPTVAELALEVDRLRAEGAHETPILRRRAP
ncbi:MAG: hypothetical protein NVSMB21_22930 [Vulcanimicrobiaceae bacterium]